MGRIIKAMLNKDVLAVACDATDVCEEARKIHGLTPVMCAVIGRTISAGLILASRLKNETDSVTVSIKGNGPAGQVTVAADYNLDVKGYAENPLVDLPPTPKGKLDVSGAVGSEGFVTVIRDLSFREPYIGRVELASGEIAEDISRYLAVSEGQPNVVFLTVIVERDYTVAAAGGVALLPLPDAKEETLSLLESAVPALQEFGKMLRTMTAIEALKSIFSGVDMEVLEEKEARYRCGCSRERLEKVMISLGPEELADMLEKDRQAEVVCRFCTTKYVFDERELKELLEVASESSL